MLLILSFYLGICVYHLLMSQTDRLLERLIREMTIMSVNVAGLQASAANLEGLVTQLIGLVETALASNSAATDAAVQKQLDDIKAGLDTSGAAAAAEVAKATPAPAAAPTGATGVAPAAAAAPTGATGA